MNQMNGPINTLPKGYSVDDMADIISKLSPRSYPTIPAINGFCFAIKRSVIETIGYFDEESFPQGYGEETDYCIRAEDSGYGCVVADDVYVFHSKSKSFGHSKRFKLSKEGWDTLKNKHTGRRLSKNIK